MFVQLLKSHCGNDNYADRGMQTINDAHKFKQVQTDSVLREVHNVLALLYLRLPELVVAQDTGMNVSNWDMYSTYESPDGECT